MKETQINLRFILDVYDAFLREKDVVKVSEALGINGDTGQFCKWLQKREDLQLAKSIADERRSKRNTFPAYVLGNLSPKAQKIWRQLLFWLENDQAQGTPELMQRASTAIRQEIFIQALIHSSYNISKACQLAGINRQTMAMWQKEGKFATLMEEVHAHKKDFFENALIDLVGMHYPGAIMFVNKTINKDRGYGEQVDINHSLNGTLDIDSLGLDLETRRKVLQAIRKQQQQKHDADNIIDAEEVKALPENTEA